MKFAHLKYKLTQYALLSRQHRPVGTWLLLGSTSWGLMVAANGQHDWRIIVIFLLGTWLMRSAGCVINDYADKDFDCHVERTKDRPLTAGRLNPKEVLWVFFSFLGVAFLCVLFLRWEAILFSFLVATLAVIYPFTKRFTFFPQLFLALAFSAAIPMTFLAYQGRVPMSAWVLFVLSFLWIVAYDTIYAMMDVEDDKKIGIKSTALFFGKHSERMIQIMQGLFVLGWIQAGWFHQATWGFWLSLIGVVVCFIYQSRLIRAGESPKLLQAFINNQWVGLLIFFGLFFFP